MYLFALRDCPARQKCIEFTGVKKKYDAQLVKWQPFYKNRL
jgi:hypothetical protein